MTTNEKIARRKLSMLPLAKELGNVSRACAIMGYSRQQFYEIRRNFQTYGAAGLLDRLRGPKAGRTPLRGSLLRADLHLVPVTIGSSSSLVVRRCTRTGAARPPRR